MDVTERIFEWIRILKTKPGMIIPVVHPTYDTLSLYLEGYIDGLGHALGRDLHRSITRWYEQKEQTLLSVGWTRAVVLLNKGRTDEELKVLLLNITEEFFLQNPDWQKIDIVRKY